jgi:hypothetical protein
MEMIDNMQEEVNLLKNSKWMDKEVGRARQLEIQVFD